MRQGKERTSTPPGAISVAIVVIVIVIIVTVIIVTVIIVIVGPSVIFVAGFWGLEGQLLNTILLFGKRYGIAFHQHFGIFWIYDCSFARDYSFWEIPHDDWLVLNAIFCVLRSQV